MAEREKKQVPVYFISRALQKAELNYTTIEKLVLSLVFAVRRLRRFFQAHAVTVLTDQPIRQILAQPDRSGRLAKWAIELGEHDIGYKPRISIKGQALADFLTEMPEDKIVVNTTEVPALKQPSWTLFTDGASSREGAGAGIILTSPTGERSTYALRFNFKCSNNEAEYEALMSGLRLAKSLRVQHLHVSTNSMLVANQINGTYEAKEVHIKKYLAETQVLLKNFKHVEVVQVPRSKNKEADALSKLASVVFTHLAKEVLVEVQPQRSIETETIQVLAIQESGQSWMTPWIKYLEEGRLPEDLNQARKIRINAPMYTILENTLYRRGFFTPWLKCVEATVRKQIIEEMHAGMCGAHTGSRAVAQKVLRAGYFWPSLTSDTTEIIRRCRSCQVHSNIPALPKTELTSISSPWPFF